MQKALIFINKVKEHNLIRDYAIGGAMGAMYYTEPFLTYDLDIFVVLSMPLEQLISLTPIYDMAKQEGYSFKEEHIIIDNLPLQILVAEGLEEEAVLNAKNITYEGVESKVISPEHLIAIFLKAGRKKDLEKTEKLLEQAQINKNSLDDILKRYGLSEKLK